MATLEQLKRGARVRGVLPTGPVTVIDVRWHGSAVELTFRDDAGRLGHELLYRDREADLDIEQAGVSFAFDGDGELFRLSSEALRIQLAYLFDPLLAVHTSMVEPLPHQITAVYGEMLPRQPLRFLLADDPGAGKTIMAGLLIKELMLRGDLQRCLIVCPGNLVEQWQDELWQRFQLDFKIVSNQTIQDSRTGNPYAEMPLLLSRLDHMSRSEDIQARLAATDWDLVVVDEAHKMSAHHFGDEVKETRRYKLGKLLGSPERTRHFLLMTATPHNGKDEDFQLFMALLDGDRFEGRTRQGDAGCNPSDMMRRLVKEQLVRFDGRSLFPERRAYTVTYRLSDREAALYELVTTYVQTEMNRADQIDGRRGNRVGFALTTLQRRLASSPEAIYQSIHRRRERLEARLREEKLLKRGSDALQIEPTRWDYEDPEDLDEATADELEDLEEEVVEQASAARTIRELEAEILTLKDLEKTALEVRNSGHDCKWEQLSSIAQDTPEMFDADGHRRKLIIFTEHRDTLNYLCRNLRTLLGRPEAVVAIYGGMGRDERKRVQETFVHDKDVKVLVATDAAGEGINLQRAHLMVNYDLPWNPNRLEQRFGRIHRIGQTEVCHMWSLVAHETREGQVFERLLHKLEVEKEALGGGVFDVLGRVFEGTNLRELLMDAIRYGDRPEVRDRLNQVVDHAMDHEHLKQLLEERALARDVLDPGKVLAVREEMERAEARRLQPHFIRSFFLEAFSRLGGSAREREPGRYEVSHVPASIRSRERLVGVGTPLHRKYERICFEKQLVSVPGKPVAALVASGHPLLEATIDLTLEHHRELLKRGSILLDPADTGTELRTLFFLEHSIQDARRGPDGTRRIASRRLVFVEIDADGVTRNAGCAPYLDYSPVPAEQHAFVQQEVGRADWLQGDLEARVVSHAVEHLIPEHLREVRQLRDERVTRTIQAVRDRLTREIRHWDHRANVLAQQEAAGKSNARLNSARARQRADELESRMSRRLDELEEERSLSPAPPLVVGGALIVPQGLLARASGQASPPPAEAEDRRTCELAAMRAVMEAEKALGYEARDVSAGNYGWDVESRTTDGLRFLEVKGRIPGASSVTITRNEILASLNKPESYLLALVQVESGVVVEMRYVQRPFGREPDFGVSSVNYFWRELWERGFDPLAALSTEVVG